VGIACQLLLAAVPELEKRMAVDTLITDSSYTDIRIGALLQEHHITYI
jgi:hypothetical protein